MLQSPPLSKVYGHGHIKKFWIMQNQKESESKVLVASSSASPSRHVSSSAGLGHESKQGPQFSLGNATSRSLSSPSGVSVRSLVSGPACFNMAMAGHVSLVTCAKSLSQPLCTDQSRSPLRPSSPSSSASISKEDKSLAEEDDPVSMGSPGRGDEVSASTSQCDSPFVLRHNLTGDVLYSYPPTSKDVFDSSAHDHLSPSKDQRQDNTRLQERLDHVKTSITAVRRENRSLEPYNCSMRIFSNLDSSSPFAVPFKLPEKYFQEAEGKPFDGEPVSDFSDKNSPSKNGTSSVSSLLDCWPGRRELSERISVNTCEASKDVYPVSVCGLRTCSLCGTSKTPLWRSGPQGPKSLCNACGIRFKKAKRSSGDGSGSPLPSPQSMKNSLKPAKRKQDTPPVNSEAHLARPLILGAPISGLATQVAKKRRWSKLIKKGECAAQKCEVTGSSGESSLTWNLHSPSAVSSPSVAQFERLSIDENTRALDMVAGKDEEEAAVLLMYMSCGLVFE